VQKMIGGDDLAPVHQIIKNLFQSRTRLRKYFAENFSEIPNCTCS
jgi:hypothetical protein